MLAERRFVLSLVSANLLPSGQNVSLAKPPHTLSSHHQSTHTRRRRARTQVPNPLPQLGQTSYPPPRRARRRAPYLTRKVPDDHVQMATDNQQEQQVSLTRSQSRLLLPRKLNRPRFRAVDIRAVVSIDPLLEGIPLSYIQQTLKDIGPR